MKKDQFPIRDFNQTPADFDKTILSLIEFEQAQIAKLKEKSEKESDKGNYNISSSLKTLDEDIQALSHAMQEKGFNFFFLTKLVD